MLSQTEKYDQTHQIKDGDRIELDYVEGLKGGVDPPPTVKEEEKRTPRRFVPAIPPPLPEQHSPPPLPIGLLPYIRLQ